MKPDENHFLSDIEQKAVRKRRARRTRRASIWLGLGMFGLVGWSVAAPMLAGLALGIWIDSTWPGRISWTLTLMMGGLIMGCANAWFWVSQERRAIERRKDEEHADDD